MSNEQWGEIMEVYEKLVHVALFNHPLEEIRPYIDKHFTGYGTAEDEYIQGWEGYRWMVERQRKEVGEGQVSITRHPVSKNLLSQNRSALIIDEFKFTTDTEEGVHSFTMRLTTLLEFKDNRWMVCHFHGSFPDLNTLDGNAWPIEEWKRRNAELQTAVNEKTAELQAQKRELEVEAALERIRARTMAMQNSKELADAAFVLFEQLRALGGNLWGTGFGLCEKDSDSDSFWFANENGVFPPVSIPNTTDPAHQQMYEGWKAGKDFLAIEASGKELKSHYDYMLSQPEVKPFFQKILDEGLTFPEWQQWNAAYFNHGYLLIITLEPYPDPDILIRFAQVFTQTYTRFLDLKKAEAQAREAQIEAALERVRSRSMGMQKSDELIGVVREIGKGIHELGIQIHYSQIFTDYTHDPKTGINIWVDVEGLNYLEKFHIPYIDHLITQRFYNPLNEGLDFFSNQFSKSDKDSYFKLLFKHSDLKKIPGKRKELILEAPGWTRVTFIFKNSTLNFGRYSLNEFTNDEKEIFKRFGKVFGQAYTRFLDLKKAEEQAREAKIETALEKVRSRSLGMQKSDELNEVVKVTFEKMRELQVPSTAVAIQTFTKGSEDMQVFVCGDVGTGLVINQYHLPYFDHPIIHDYIHTYENKPGYYVGTYSKKEKDSFYDFVLELPELAELPDEVRTMIRESEFYEVTMVPAGHSLVAVNDFQGKSLNDDQIHILKRFAQVFDQTYTRFLDLQKAEELAREAQIEAALERVRSRSMGMQKSTDLRGVVDTLYGEFESLGLDFNNVVIQLLLDDTKDFYMWITSGDGLYEDIIHWPYVDIPVFHQLYRARTGNKIIDYCTSSEAETRAFFEEYFKLETAPQERKEAIKNVKVINCMGAYQQFTGVFLMRYTEGEYSDKDKRSSGVFRRFLSKPTPAFLIFRRQKNRQGKLPNRRHWTGYVEKSPACGPPMIWRR